MRATRTISTGTALTVAVIAGALVSAQGAVPAVTPKPMAPPALAILQQWDHARARAWAEGDTRALAGLYATKSRAGESDVRALKRWVARGFVVRRMERQILEARVVRSGSHTIVLDVTDRLRAAVAQGPEAAVRLPASRVRRWVLRIVRTDQTWQMASVRSLDRAVR